MSITNNLLYKKVKQYKNLENHFIISKISKKGTNVLGRKNVPLKFKFNDNISFRISHRNLNYRNLIKKHHKKFIYNFDTEKNILNKSLKIWFFNNNIKMNYPLQKLYLNKIFLKNQYNLSKYIFFNVELKDNLKLLKDKRKVYFSYKTIWKKLYTSKYNKIFYKKLIKMFLIKQNKIFIKNNLNKNDIKIKIIFLGFNKRNYYIYIPEFYKIKSLTEHSSSA